jgi:hypothetical protein
MYRTLELLLKENEGKEIRVNDYNFKVVNGKLNLYYELTSQYLPICLSQLGIKYINKIEEALNGEKGIG